MAIALTTLILGILFLFVMFGAAFGIDSRRKIRDLNQRIEQLEKALARTSQKAAAIQPTPSVAIETHSEEELSDSTAKTTQVIAEAGFQPSEGAIGQIRPTNSPQASSPQASTRTERSSRPARKPATRSRRQKASPSWWESIANMFATFPTGNQSTNGLFWLGGIVLAFGGLFLAKYTLEAGLLSPVARVLLGFGVGIGLIVTAEYFMQKKVRFRIHSDYLSAALAAGGVITCYSMTLVASHYYALISFNLAFVILAVIALTATGMALRYGPIVAVIGILGAYSVPLPFWHLDYGVLAIASYVALVSASAIVVANQVQRSWLWWLSFAAHFSWFFIMVVIAGRGEAIAVVVFSLLSLYLYVLSGVLGWRLQNIHLRPLPIKTLLMPRKEQAGLLASILPIWLFYIIYGYQPGLILATVVVLIVLCTMPLRHSAFDTWPILGLVLSIFTLKMQMPLADYNDLDFMFTGAHLYTQAIALAFFLYALYMQRCYPKRLAYSLLLVVAPSSLFAISYILSPLSANTAMYSLWAVELALIAATAVKLTMNNRWGWVKLSGLLLANANVSLIFTMLLESSTLTLALCAQIIGLGYWCRRFALSPPAWLVKLILAVLLIRLSLFPWIDGYSQELLLGVHWTIIAYPLIIAMLYFARRYYEDTILRLSLGGAILHIAALLVTTESSYQLLGRYPDFVSPSYNEAVLLAMNWLIMAGVYAYRSQHSSSLKQVYLGFATLLATASGIYHVVFLTFANPWFIQQTIGELPVWNWLLPLWLFPALTLLAISRLSFFLPTLRLVMYGITSLWVFQLINGTIRHQFHDDMIWLGLPTGELEMYTYSLVWLILSLALIVLARRLTAPLISKVGFGLLAIVVCKAFLIDMSQLTGLYRALSFLGLGISLLGVGWLSQKMKNTHDLSTSDSP